MSGTVPTPRRIAGALAVLQALPAPALALLAARLIDRLDALDGDPDMEPDDDSELTPDDEGDLDGPPVVGQIGCGPALVTARGRRPGRRGSFLAANNTGGVSARGH